MHAHLLGDREQQRPEQHDGGNALEHAAQDDEDHDRHGNEAGLPPGHCGHRLSEILREARLGQRPGHGGGGSDDEQDRARKRCGLHQHGQQPAPVELAVDQQAGDDRVTDADGGDFGGGRHALHDCGANHEGQGDRRHRDQQAAQDLRAARALHVRQVLVAIAPPHQRAQRQSQHHCRQHPAGKQGGDRDPCHRPDREQHQAGGNGFGLRAGRGEQRNQVALLRTAPLHLRKQDGCDSRHIGGLGAGDARYQIHRSHQHVVQPAAHVAQQIAQERDHRPRHTGHLDQQAEEDEQWNRQQDQMGHAFVDAPDNRRHRDQGGDREVAIRGEPEGKGDRHAGEDVERDDADEENQQVLVIELEEHRLKQEEDADAGADQRERTKDETPASRFHQSQQRDKEHECTAYWKRGGAPGIGDPQSRRGDHYLVVGELVGGIDNERKKDQRRGNGQHIEERARRRRYPADDGGHAHVLAAAQCHHRTQHRQPDEENRGEFVRPEDRLVENVARHYTCEQDGHLDGDEQGGSGFDGGPDRGFQRHQPLRRPCPRCEDSFGIGEFGAGVHLISAPRHPSRRLAMHRPPAAHIWPARRWCSAAAAHSSWQGAAASGPRSDPHRAAGSRRR